MRCPFCGSDDNQVKDSRPVEEGGSVRRRRQCNACGARFTTFERIQLRELTVTKRDGKRVAFVRGGNLFTAGPNGEKQLTTDGGGDVLNAKHDWVYFEELYNRNYKAYWWSPDGSAVAFFRFNTKPVKEFTITDPIPDAGRVETYPYPKVGSPNPTVQIGVVPDTLPHTGFQIFRQPDRHVLSLSPFRLGEQPNIRVGVAMITSAPEALALHQKAAEEMWGRALKGGAAAGYLRDLMRRTAH